MVRGRLAEFWAEAGLRELLPTRCALSMSGALARLRVLHFFSLPLIFTLVAASISHFLTAATKFHVVPPTKNVSFAFLSLALALFLDKLRWPFALLSRSLCLCLSLFSKFVGMKINLNVIL